MISPLARLVSTRPDPTAEDGIRLAREAWRDTGIVLLRPEWFGDLNDRRQAIALAEKLHGKRNG